MVRDPRLATGRSAGTDAEGCDTGHSFAQCHRAHDRAAGPRKRIAIKGAAEVLLAAK